MRQRWTIRGVDPAAIAIIRSARIEYGGSSGELVTEAIKAWHAHLSRGRFGRRQATAEKTTSSMSELLRRLRGFAS